MDLWISCYCYCCYYNSSDDCYYCYYCDYINYSDYYYYYYCLRLLSTTTNY